MCKLDSCRVQPELVACMQWDFSSGALHRPKLQVTIAAIQPFDPSDLSTQATHHQRVSMSSTISLAFRRDRSALYLPSPTVPGADGNTSPRYHPAPSRNEIAVVQPVLVSFLALVH
jgi:catabolite repression protein CreC